MLCLIHMLCHGDGMKYRRRGVSTQMRRISSAVEVTKSLLQRRYWEADCHLCVQEIICSRFVQMSNIQHRCDNLKTGDSEVHFCAHKTQPLDFWARWVQSTLYVIWGLVLCLHRRVGLYHCWCQAKTLWGLFCPPCVLRVTYFLFWIDGNDYDYDNELW